MDEYIENVQHVLDTESSDLSIEDLNRILIKITTYSYFMCTRQEILGIRHDIADLMLSEKYNSVYMAQTAGTVPTKTAKATEGSKEEKVMSVIFDRAYKIIKLKNEAAIRMIDSVKKIVSSRLQEMQLANREV